MPTNIRDPRSVITPDAFEIDPRLLGTPLAGPWRRLAAILIDLLVIGLLTAVTSGLGVLIWGLVGFVLLQTAIRRPAPRFGQVTSFLYRGSVGCLGGTILLIVLLVGVARLVSRDERVAASVESAISEMVVAFAPLAPAAELRKATTRAEAEAAAQALLTVGTELDPELRSDPLGMAEALRLVIPADAPYAEDRVSFAEEMVEIFRARALAGGAPPADSVVSHEQLAALDALELPAALALYREGVEAGRLPATDPAQARLRDRLLDAVAADTLSTLRAALDSEEGRSERLEADLGEVRTQLEEEQAGFVPLLRDIWDQAGSVVGLWSLYFTMTLTLFHGYTVGKRAMGIRVVRLDGESFTWWTSFERGGGYVAGIATGLLGFAQVFWDPNRQCVHDKIVGTAVVVAGAAPLKDAVSSTWTEAASPEP